MTTPQVDIFHLTTLAWLQSQKQGRLDLSALYVTAGTGRHQGWNREPRLTQPTQYGPDEQANDVGQLSQPDIIVSLTSSQATV
ncbi:uncharacterized protein PGTG_21695 [Puccinia graminis f. sp. tritici CRL 75-36-700-3]|uniref:Uncharacterized protein n=1 Tax=Puccinia graminis f. sp. tritici (strain CRL 75-36-700-3 / race SCCL) TaxID=418459 RepID=H6QS46_PUCGT|nr:uncharacterized protein PGTG_21695 [Puccinia graminis f. sp. tritici CRL 75-36-700-3]EHS63519.1 hypothetical protein PGTG_21695 [Puccinia graminis f. sp. tritici CRL 75-36-700-3]